MPQRKGLKKHDQMEDRDLLSLLIQISQLYKDIVETAGETLNLTGEQMMVKNSWNFTRYDIRIMIFFRNSFSLSHAQ